MDELKREPSLTRLGLNGPLPERARIWRYKSYMLSFYRRHRGNNCRQDLEVFTLSLYRRTLGKVFNVEILTKSLKIRFMEKFIDKFWESLKII